MNSIESYNSKEETDKYYLTQKDKDLYLNSESELIKQKDSWPFKFDSYWKAEAFCRRTPGKLYILKFQVKRFSSSRYFVYNEKPDVLKNESIDAIYNNGERVYL